MKRIASAHLPLKRQQGLVIEELPDEVLVYDLERHKAHCLNQTAGLVWKYCDGRTSPQSIAYRLEKELLAPCPEDVVWLALRELDSLDLLAQPITLPPPMAGISRRQVMRTLGLAAVVALPIITSMVSPTPADAATCANLGQSCVGKPCCAGQGVCNGSICV